MTASRWQLDSPQLRAVVRPTCASCCSGSADRRAVGQPCPALMPPQRLRQPLGRCWAGSSTCRPPWRPRTCGCRSQAWTMSNSSTLNGRCAQDPVAVVCPKKGHAQTSCLHIVIQISPPNDASVQVALLSPFVQREVLRSGHGVSEDDPVVLPKQVCAALHTHCKCRCFPALQARSGLIM